MSENMESLSGGSVSDKSEIIRKSMRTTLNGLHKPHILLPMLEKKEDGVVEKDYTGDGEQAGLGSALGLGRFSNTVKRTNNPDPENFRDSSSAVSKTAHTACGVAEELVQKVSWDDDLHPRDAAGKELGESISSERINKEYVEKVLKESGWDKLPMTDRAREILEGAISNGATPVTEYTGKVMIEHALAEEPPAFVRPQSLNVGDRVIPLNWVSVGRQAAKFDLPYVPEVARVSKMYVGPAKVTKNAYPPGRVPRDFSKCEMVTEERLWGLELEDEVRKSDDLCPCPVTTKDSTMVLRLEPLAQPSGEVAS